MVSVDEDLWKKAKEAQLNISGFLDDALQKKVYVKMEMPDKDMVPAELTDKQKEIKALAREFVEAFRKQILEGIKDNLTGKEPQWHDGIKIVMGKSSQEYSNGTETQKDKN